MNQDTNEIKKRLAYQMADDFYSRFESNEQKLERLRGLQHDEVTLPGGFEIEGEVRAPHVAEMHSMLLGGIQSRVGPVQVPVPEGSENLAGKDRRRTLEEGFKEL